MTQNWKGVITLGVAVAILLAIIYIKTGPRVGQYSASQNNKSNSLQPVTPVGSITPAPPATGNPDAASSALLQAAGEEQSTVDIEQGDSANVSSDSQSINNVGQSYNENDY